MPSVFVLRTLLGAGIGIGALDLVWINAALVPRLLEPEHAPAVVVLPAPAVAPPAPVEPPAPPPAPPAPIVDHVYFDTDSAAITARSHKTLAALAAAAGPTAQISLEGHADYRGTEALNKMLSRDRAVAVQHELVRLGLDAARIRVEYVGATQEWSELWRDRRVDIQMTGGTR